MSYIPEILFSRADKGFGFCLRKKYSFFLRRWSRLRVLLSSILAVAGRRKRGFCLTFSVKSWVAVSGEWARERRSRAIGCFVDRVDILVFFASLLDVDFVGLSSSCSFFFFFK